MTQRECFDFLKRKWNRKIKKWYSSRELTKPLGLTPHSASENLKKLANFNLIKRKMGIIRKQTKNPGSRTQPGPIYRFK